MVSRLITEEDRSILAASLLEDEYHKDTPASFFYEDGTVCLVYSDEEGIVLFARGRPFEYEGKIAIQLDLQYLNNLDAKRNMRTMLEGFPELEARALENGFSAFFFFSNVPLLRKFCITRLGFSAFNDDVLVKVLQEA